MSKTAFLFPGQGAQHVGMGQEIYDAFVAARAVFERAEAVTELPLRTLCFEGPDEELARTDIAQPAIFTVSAAMLACLDSLLEPEKVAGMRPEYMAGLSLGEYTALFAADMINFEDALKLVTLRGRAMQDAAMATPSSMVAVIGLDEDAARELCEATADGQILTCANFNCPGQIVLSGEKGACERAARKAEAFGASGAKVLSVAGAFHSELMAPAADELARALNELSFRRPRGQKPDGDDRNALKRAQVFASPEVTVLANIDATACTSPDSVKSKLLAQLTGAVRWQQCMEWLLAEGVESFYEIGPGRVLAGLMRRIDRKTRVTSVNSRKSLESVLEA